MKAFATLCRPDSKNGKIRLKLSAVGRLKNIKMASTVRSTARSNWVGFGIGIGWPLGHPRATQASPKGHAREAQASIDESLLFATRVEKWGVGVGEIARIAMIAKNRRD